MEALKKLATHMSDESKRTDKHWDDIANNIVNASQTYNKGFLGAFSRLTDTHRTVSNIAHTLAGAMTLDRSHMDDMEKRYADLYRMWDSMRDPSKSAGGQSKAVKDIRRQLVSASNELEKHRGLYETITSLIQSKMGPAMAASLGLIVLTVRNSALLNKELIQASASTADRGELMSDIAHTQAMTGTSMDQMAKAAAALTRYGFDLKSEFRGTLEIVVQMEEGLGVSLDTSAELAVMAQRLGTNMRQVADGIARVKADTALSAEEASKFGIEIAKAINLLKPGRGGMANEVIEYVDRLAGALRQVGGNAGDIKDLMVGMTKMSGMMGAATLGLQPGFLTSPEGAKKGAERFVTYVNTQLQGMERGTYAWMAQVELLAQQFNTTTDMIVNADAMLKEYSASQAHATDLQEEWRKQTSQLGEAMSKIGHSFMSLTQTVILPALNFVRPAFEKVAEVLQLIAQNSWAAWIVGVPLTVAIASTAVTMGLLAKEMWAATAAGIAYQKVIAGQAGAGAMGKLFAASSLTRIIPALMSYLGPIALMIGAVAIGWQIGKLINYGFEKLGKRLGFGEVKVSGGLAAQTDLREISRGMFERNVAGMMYGGKSVAEISRYMLENVGHIAGLKSKSTMEGQQEVMRNVLKDLAEAAEMQKARVVVSGGLVSQSQEDKKYLELLGQYLDKIAKNGDLGNKLAVEGFKAYKEAMEKQRTAAETEARDKALREAHGPVGPGYRRDMPLF